MMARAIPTRRLMPPESSDGSMFIVSSSSTKRSASRTRLSISSSGRPSSTRRKATLSRTLSESKSALSWKTIPILLRSSKSCSSVMAVTSWPRTKMRPESGLISPRQSLRIVLLPEPDTPKTTLVSPRRSSKETPSRMGVDSKVMATLSKMMVLWMVSGDGFSGGNMVCMVPDITPPKDTRTFNHEEHRRRRCRSHALCSFVSFVVDRLPFALRALAEYEYKQLGQKEINRDDAYRRRNHGLRARAAHALCAAARAHPVVAADGGDDEAENERLAQSHDHVGVVERLVGLVPVLKGIEPEQRDGDEPSADQSHQIGDDGQEKKHEHCRNNPGRDQLLVRIGAQGAHGVNLLGHLHGAEFAGDAGSVAAGHHQTGEHRPEFAHHGDGNQFASERERAELAQSGRIVERQHRAGADPDHDHTGQRAAPDEGGLLDHVPEVARPAKKVRHGLGRQKGIFLDRQYIALQQPRGRDKFHEKRNYSRAQACGSKPARGSNAGFARFLSYLDVQAFDLLIER